MFTSLRLCGINMLDRMDIHMRVLAWNVQGAWPSNGNKDRIHQQIEFIETTAALPEVLMLNEVTTAQRELWRDRLQDLGYSQLVDTLDWANELRDSDIPPFHDANHVNGNLTAVHDEFAGEDLTRLRPSIWSGPWADADLKDWDTNLPEKILHAQMDIDDTTIDLWNIRAVPGGTRGEEKVKILENVYNRILKGCEPPCILTGDFNAPAEERPDGTTVPTRHHMDGPVARRWDNAELSILTGLEEMGMVDVFREQHGYGDLDILDVSHPPNATEALDVPPEEVEGRRIDHIIASRELNPQDCLYEQEGFNCSDHAPIIATFRI
jgi:exodeoxyribonuclease-3